jgi:hypothetical protein
MTKTLHDQFATHFATQLAVNGSVGNISTTALGAVNTGAITNGVNAAVQGIVGMSGQF